MARPTDSKKSLSKSIGKASNETETKNEPLWEGPQSDGPNGGITQSLLSRFLVCPERFRLLTILGLATQEGFNHSLEFGNMFHLCEEYNIQGQDWAGALKLYAQELCVKYPLQQEQVEHWYNICKITFPVYAAYWERHENVQETTPLIQEVSFKIPYILPSSRTVYLRGKWDSVEAWGKGKNKLIFLKENKTKGEINEESLKRQLSSGFDIQTMLYLVSLNRAQKLGKYCFSKGLNQETIKGVLYNVIRRPLSGGKHSIRQHKPTKSNPMGETKGEFYARLSELIREEAQLALLEKRDCYYFMRWRIDVGPWDIEKFQRECLDPILERLCDWYDWVAKDGRDDPFRIPFDGDLCYPVPAFHFRFPLGVYNPITDGRGETDLDEYLNTGSMVGLRRADSLFGELG